MPVAVLTQTVRFHLPTWCYLLTLPVSTIRGSRQRAVFATFLFREASYPDANAERLPAAEHERRNDGNGNGEETQPLMEGDGAGKEQTTTTER